MSLDPCFLLEEFPFTQLNIQPIKYKEPLQSNCLKIGQTP